MEPGDDLMITYILIFKANCKCLICLFLLSIGSLALIGHVKPYFTTLQKTTHGLRPKRIIVSIKSNMKDLIVSHNQKVKWKNNTKHLKLARIIEQNQLKTSEKGKKKKSSGRFRLVWLGKTADPVWFGSVWFSQANGLWKGLGQGCGLHRGQGHNDITLTHERLPQLGTWEHESTHDNCGGTWTRENADKKFLKRV